MDEFINHEVGHLKHIEESGNPIKYIGSFILDYISNFGHDDVPREKEAEKGRMVLNAFYKFINRTYESKTAMEDLFKSNKSDKAKIDTIDKWWKEFVSSQRRK